jgi:hypothetical protein
VLILQRFSSPGILATLMLDGDAARRPEHKLEAFTIEMSPTPGSDCLGLISNSDKTGSGQEHGLSYRIMVDAGLTPTGFRSLPLMAFAAAPAA